MTKAKPTTVKKIDNKSEFLKELVEKYTYWTSKGVAEYATAYERLIYAFTTPKNAE